MLVSDMMTKRPVVARPDTSVPNALKIMQGSQVRMLPVLDEKEKLVGVVSLTDLFRALPSPASSLSRWEVEYLLDQVKVDEVMTTQGRHRDRGYGGRRGRAASCRSARLAACP